jgi:hypothetical protein
MNSFIFVGLMTFVVAICGLSERFKSLSGETAGSNTASAPGKTASGDTNAETPNLTPGQQALIDAAEEVTWDAQGISWKLPKGWKKMNVLKESFNYGSADNAFLIGSISVMSNDFPSDISLKATYDSSLQQLKNGKYENVRYVQIDGVKGVEWIEAMPELRDGARRHQWIAFRNYQGQNQQLNIMLSTTGTNFEKHRDEFAAIMYSMKIAK